MQIYSRLIKNKTKLSHMGNYDCHSLVLLSSFMSYRRIFNNNNATEVPLELQDLAILPEAQEFNPSVSGGFELLNYQFLCSVVQCRPSFVLLSYFTCPLYCLSFYELRLLITSLISLNVSKKHFLFSGRMWSSQQQVL